MSTNASEIDLATYVDEFKADAIHAYNFLKETGTLSASLTFNVLHRIPGHEKFLAVRFPQPWSKDREVTISFSDASDNKESVLNEPRLDADTFVHAHTPYLAAWSLAHKPFPILYVAAQRHLLAREIPNHLERKRSVLEVIRERLDAHPELAPSPGILEWRQFLGKRYFENRAKHSVHRRGCTFSGTRRANWWRAGLHPGGSGSAVAPHRAVGKGTGVCRLNVFGSGAPRMRLNQFYLYFVWRVINE